MPDPTLSDNRPGDAELPIIEDLAHLQQPMTSSKFGQERRAGDPESAESLRRQLDVVQVKLLTAVDAVAGAEAERSAAQARIRELEHQHHMLEVERDELRREVDNLGPAGHSLARRAAGRLMSSARTMLSGRH